MQAQVKAVEREERRKAGCPAGSVLGHVVNSHMTVICMDEALSGEK